MPTSILATQKTHTLHPQRKNKSFRELERIARGFSNHRRIQIMELLSHQPELSVMDIARKLEVHFKTISEHTRRLANAGIVMKRNQGRDVCHALTKRGKFILTFLRTLE